MEITAFIAQFPISLSISENLESILAALESAHPGDLALFPEGSLSGYSHDLSFLDQVDHQALDAGLERLSAEARARSIHLWVGAVMRVDDRWRNAAIGFTPQGDTHIYHKINLATHERGTFVAGSELPVFHLDTSKGELTVGVQICRELRYPEQWGWLARSGAQLILHLNNAIGDARFQPVWRSHLVSRAAETQRYVLSANNAAPEQVSPTIAIAPDGFPLGELVSAGHGALHVTLDISRCSTWYLDQCRPDIVMIW